MVAIVIATTRAVGEPTARLDEIRIGRSLMSANQSGRCRASSARERSSS